LPYWDDLPDADDEDAFDAWWQDHLFRFADEGNVDAATEILRDIFIALRVGRQLPHNYGVWFGGFVNRLMKRIDSPDVQWLLAPPPNGRGRRPAHSESLAKAIHLRTNKENAVKLVEERRRADPSAKVDGIAHDVANEIAEWSWPDDRRPSPATVRNWYYQSKRTPDFDSAD
jgi:hypothetical protein